MRWPIPILRLTADGTTEDAGASLHGSAAAVAGQLRKAAPAGRRVAIVAVKEPVEPHGPQASALLAAMDAADARLLLLPAREFDPVAQDYWQEVDRARAELAAWGDASRRFNVRPVCCQGSGHQLGSTAAGLSHLVMGLDPRRIGVCLCAGPSEEPFPVSVAMVREYLAFITIADGVDWPPALKELRRVGYTGPFWSPE